MIHKIKFAAPSSLSQTPWGLIVTYPTKENTSNAVTINMGLYSSEGIGLPGIGQNSFWINADKYFNYSNGEPNFYVRRLKQMSICVDAFYKRFI